SGVRLPRSTQVSLMKKLDRLVEPAAGVIKTCVMNSGYIHLDPTPVPLCDPAQPGGTVESTVWAYQADGEPLCWYQFEHARGKSPTHPDRELKAAGFAGLLQVDGAGGLTSIGLEEQVIALGCFSHARRPAYQAVADGDKKAEPYLAGFNRLFRLDRLAKHFKLTAEHKHWLRLEYSLPLFELLVAMAETDRPAVPPKTPFGECLTYLLEQQEYLQRCITIRGADLTNNAAERSLRPLKMGVNNWQWIGHPKAGPRLANLFTLIENCRQVGADVAAYLSDLITRLPGQPAGKITALLPAAWKSARDEAKSSADPPAA
ncbi:MAG TPA: transposase, partial [Candidatus Limnocylindrales bacterium]|nr:transposase [Candidatus Limnocylindrales bacterium]